MHATSNPSATVHAGGSTPRDTAAEPKPTSATKPITQDKLEAAHGVVRNITSGQHLAETLRGILAHNPKVLAKIGLRSNARSYVDGLAMVAWETTTDLPDAERAPFLRSLASMAPQPLPAGPLGPADRTLITMLRTAPHEHLDWICRLFTRILEHCGKPPEVGAIDPEQEDLLEHAAMTEDPPAYTDDLHACFLGLQPPLTVPRRRGTPISRTDLRTYLVPMAEICAQITNPRYRRETWKDWCYEMEMTSPHLAAKVYGELLPMWQDLLPVPTSALVAAAAPDSEPWQPLERAAHLANYSVGGLQNIIPQLYELDPDCVKKTTDGHMFHVPKLKHLKKSKRIISQATWRKRHPTATKSKP